MFWGAFENDILIGVAILESNFIGSLHDTLQLKFLHISHNYRHQGLGTTLFNIAVEKAKMLGAKNYTSLPHLPRIQSITIFGGAVN
jgi:predicted N-acetyltransferase YhbS